MNDPLPNRMRAATVALSVFVVAATVGPVDAQWSVARIVGVVRDASGAAVPGARVTIESSVAPGRARHFETDAEGRYDAPNLAPGTYVVSATKTGLSPATRRGIEVLVGGRQVVDFTLHVGTFTEEVSVNGNGIDATSPAIPQYVPESFLRDLPTNRSVPDLVNLVPGVVAQVAFGGTQGSNALSVDGVDMTDTMGTTPYLRLNQNWLDGVQVASFGAGAEYGATTGVFANATVRSGGRAWSGLAEFWTVPQAWVGDNTGGLEASLRREFAPRDIEQSWSVNAQAGGPILPERLWIFAGVEYARLRERPAGYDGPERRSEQDTLAIAKLTWAPTESVRTTTMVNVGRHLDEANDLGPFVAPEAAVDSTFSQLAWSASLSWAASGRTVVEARYGGFDAPTRGASRAPASCDGPAPHFDAVTGVSTGNAWECYHTTRRRDELGASLATTRATGPLRHELLAGGTLMLAGGRNRFSVPGGAQYVDADGERMLVRVTPGYSRTVNSSTASAFVEDHARVGGRLTIVAGARLDVNRASTPQASGAVATTPVSPRVGVAYELGGHHRTLVRTHWGRYHDPVAVTAFRTSQTDLSDSPPVVEWAPTAGGGLEEVKRITSVQALWVDPDLRQSRVDEWMAGIERDAGQGFRVQAQYMARRFDDFIGYIDTGSTWTSIARQDPGPDGRLGTSDDGGSVSLFRKTNPGNEHLVYTNPPGAVRRYDAAQVVVRRPYSGTWQAQASYTWSRTSGNTSNAIYGNSGFGDLATTFANPNRAINAYGRGPYDPTHEVKALGSYRLGALGGFIVSGVYRYTTGYAWGREASFPGAGLGTGAVRMEPAGTRRVAPVNNLDLRVGKTIALGSGRRLVLFVDGFNLTNQGVPDSDVSSPVWTVSGPNLGLPTAWRPARSWRATVRVTL